MVRITQFNMILLLRDISKKLIALKRIKKSIFLECSFRNVSFIIEAFNLISVNEMLHKNALVDL